MRVVGDEAIDSDIHEVGDEVESEWDRKKGVESVRSLILEVNQRC